jgi:hypothetical protein
MPIEHEHKFVLNPSLELYDRVKKNYYPRFQITQFYVSDAARYREIRRNESLIGAEWVFTHKLAVGQDVLEHEIDVPKSDYDLARKRALGTLYKIRFKDSAGWDIDFFLDGPHGTGSIYFAMAEFEHTRGTAYEVLPILADSVIYRVPEEEAVAYSNRKLTDVMYTKRLLSRLRREHVDV